MIDEHSYERLRLKWNLCIIGIYIKNGIRRVKSSPSLQRNTLLFAIGIISVAMLIYGNRPDGKTMFLDLSELSDIIIGFLLRTAVLIGITVWFYKIGRPPKAKQTSDNLKRAGFVNHAGEAPLLLSVEEDDTNPHIKILTFHTLGIPFGQWEEDLQSLESALNLHIDSFEQGNDSRSVKVYAVDGSVQLPTMLPWKDEYLERDGFRLVLGESLVRRVTVDLGKVPHILIGGSTGSGKSVLLKLLLMQCVKKNAEVIIADFKGGVDFPPIWHSKCRLIIEKADLANALEKAVAELNRRKRILRESGKANIDEYNQAQNSQLHRIIIACDEVAEVLDKTGLSKEDKAAVSETEALFSVIARQGRACGIHAIFATQRPSADILTGQIKNNIDYRVCGRADQVLSMVILDKADANERVPKHAQGRFLDNNDTLFQAYWFDEERW